MDEVFSVTLSVLALGFSAFVFIESRRRDRRDIFLKMTEYLTSEDIQRGRQLLYEKVTDEDSVRRLNDEQYRDIHRAMNAFNILGLYVKNRYLSEGDVLDVWAVPVYRGWQAAQPYVTHRERAQGSKTWTYFEALAKKCLESLESKGENVEFTVWHRQYPDIRSGSIGPEGGSS
jgi:hypothetical protein